MSKRHYFFKLVPPRSTFPQDITDDENQLMKEHARYFQQHFAEGRVLVFGPVMVPGGAFGLAVLEVEDEAEARNLARTILPCLQALIDSRSTPCNSAAHRVREPEDFYTRLWIFRDALGTPYSVAIILFRTRASSPTPLPPFAWRSQISPPAPSIPQSPPPTRRPSAPTHLPRPAVLQPPANAPASSPNTAPPSDPQSKLYSRPWVPHPSRVLCERMGSSTLPSSPNKPSAQ